MEQIATAAQAYRSIADFIDRQADQLPEGEDRDALIAWARAIRRRLLLRRVR
jgi:hypothetical protein